MDKEIIFVMNCLTSGGIERVASEIIDNISSRVSKITIVRLRPDLYHGSYELSADNIEWIDYYPISKNRLIWHLGHIWYIWKLMGHRKNATVIAMNNPQIRIVGIASLLFRKNRIIFSERNDPNRVPHAAWSRRLRDILFLLPDACVFQTEEAKNHFSKRIQDKGVIIPNPINPRLPERFLDEHKKTIVAVGRLHPQKNFPMLFKAFKQLSGDYPEFVLEIYGEGPERKKLQKIIDTYSLSDKISLKGFVNNIFDRVRECYMYVSSSDYEGISNSMLEAMGMGLPVVCTDCPAGGARMAIQNGENGLLVPVGDSKAMYEAMRSLIDDPTLAKRLAENAYRIRERYSIDIIGQQWLDLM